MYELKSFEHLLGLNGFSDQLFKNHFNLYQGYVNNTNKLIESLIGLSKEGKSSTPEYAELKRRFGLEFNGMRLHELYFENMTKETAAPPNAGTLLEKITEYFGSVESWEKDFKTTGLMRGIGWGILSHDTRAGKLFNVWVNEHDLGHLPGATPLLVMDVFEHA